MSAKSRRVVAYGVALLVAVGVAVLVEPPRRPSEVRALDSPSPVEQPAEGLVYSNQAAVQAAPSPAFPERGVEVRAEPAIHPAVNEKLAIDPEPEVAADSVSSGDLMPIGVYLDADDPRPDYTLADEALAVGEFLDADR